MTTQQQAEARKLREALGNNLPSSLRGPLGAVIRGEEVPGTAEEVLVFARAALAKACITRIEGESHGTF